MNIQTGVDDSFRHSVDILKGITIYGIIGIHFGGSFLSADNAWTLSFEIGLIFNQFFSYGVPLFIFLAGVLSRTSFDKQNFRVVQYYRRRLLRLGIPYVAVSVVSFILLNHINEFAKLHSILEIVRWLTDRLLYHGVEPTLYFVPLLLHLTLLMPLLVYLPNWLTRVLDKSKSSRFLSVEYLTLFIGIALALAHATIAHACYNGTLNYYIWARPCFLFWAFIFFVGLHYKTLTGFVPKTIRPYVFLGSAVGAAMAFGINIIQLHNTNIVGLKFEHSLIDLAYVRPVVLVFNCLMLVSCSFWLDLELRLRIPFLELFGRSSYAIYLWHILFLYEIAWARPSVLLACRQLPENIIIIITFTALVISLTGEYIVPFLVVKVRQLLCQIHEFCKRQ
jgi:peptidoglycan/LPS O-acetylase OafA/YrhL